MYADSDFFFALLKKEDWLKKRAETLFHSKQKEIWTSVATMIELLYKGSMTKLNITEAFFSLQNLVPIVPLTREHLITAAQLRTLQPNLGVMDGIHAAVAQSIGEKSIISSDKIFEQLGFDRISLEKEE